MKITLRLQNPPAGAAYWWPVLYSRPVGGTVWSIHEPEKPWPMSLADVGEFYLPDGIEISARMVIYRTDQSIIDTRDFPSLPVRGLYTYDWTGNKFSVLHWITIAEGDTLEDLQDNAEGKYVYGSFRLEMFTRNAPGWVLSSLSWLINALAGPLGWFGVKLAGTEVRDQTILISLYKNPVPIALVPLIIRLATIAAIVTLAVFVFRWKISQEVTEQLATNLKIVQTTKDAADVIIADPDLPPEVKETLLRLIYEQGAAAVKPRSEGGIDWEKYLRGALIGGGILLGAVLLLPTIIRRPS